MESINRYKNEYHPFSELTGDKVVDSKNHFPSKLIPWYKYAYDFIGTLRKKQPKVVLKKRYDPNTKVTALLFLSNHLEITMKLVDGGEISV